MTVHGDVDLLIFDCDGVLVDTEPIAVRANVRIGAELGWPLTPDEAVQLFLGRSAVSIGAQIADRLGAEAALAWDERFRREHTDAVDAGLTTVDGVEEALDALETMGYDAGRRCIASSGTHDKMRHTLGRTGLIGRFEGRIFSAHEVREGKPAPDLFLHAAHRLGVEPRRCVVIEDSRYGAEAAAAAGMRCLGYAGGLTPAAWLDRPGTTVFTDMRELPALVAALG